MKGEVLPCSTAARSLTVLRSVLRSSANTTLKNQCKVRSSTNPMNLINTRPLSGRYQRSIISLLRDSSVSFLTV